jgi:hypothetical protein
MPPVINLQGNSLKTRATFSVSFSACLMPLSPDRERANPSRGPVKHVWNVAALALSGHSAASQSHFPEALLFHAPISARYRRC